MKNRMLFILLILFLIFPVISCGQKETAKNENKNNTSKPKKITEQEYENIRKQVQSEVDKKIRRITTNEIRNNVGSKSVIVKITQDFLPPDRSKWIIQEKSENKIETTEIIYMGDAEYRKENGKDWLMRNTKSNNSDNGSGFTAKGEEKNKEFTSGEIEIDGEIYRILVSKTVNSQIKIVSVNKIWINKNNLIYKEESRSWIGSFDNVISFSTSDYDYDVKDIKIEAPIK